MATWLTVITSSNLVQVLYNDPPYTRGDLDIENTPDDMPGEILRAALCRCGQSKNKPFCDNSHLKAGFEDYGAVGKSGSDLEQKVSTLSIKAAINGPLMLKGNFAIRAGRGRNACRGNQAVLCRWGHSKNKPFCDGSHKHAGFEAE